MLGVTDAGAVDILVSPAGPSPRRDPKRCSRLVTEHQRRRGDPTSGGGNRAPVMTAYRQRALACAALMATGITRPRDLRVAAPDVASILRNNVYGWFVKAERGVYGLTDAGREALGVGRIAPPLPGHAPIVMVGLVPTTRLCARGTSPSGAVIRKTIPPRHDE